MCQKCGGTGLVPTEKPSFAKSEGPFYTSCPDCEGKVEKVTTQGAVVAEDVFGRVAIQAKHWSTTRLQK